MDTKITFIHAADLHLDSPFKGLSQVPETIFPQIRHSTFQAFDNLVNLAIKNKVDFVLLVGDLFDNEKQSLKAQVHLRNGFEKLEQCNINVYLSYGNHDYVKGNVHPITYPNNVYIFNSEEISTFTYIKDGMKLAQIYGFSYENRAVLGNKTDGFIRDDESIPFHIGMLHGTLYGNEEHDPYAPFKLSDLQSKSFDYWALGHIHKQEILSMHPSIVYSGNIQGRHRHEASEKGCYIVSLTKKDAQLNFVPLQSIIFNDLTIDITNCQSIHEIEPLIFEQITNKETAQLIYIEFTGDSEKLYKWNESHLLDEIIDILNESFLQKTPWVFIYRYVVKHEKRANIRTDDYFMDEYFQAVDQLEVRHVMQQLLHHRDAQQFIELFTEAEQAEIKERAKQLIVNELY